MSYFIDIDMLGDNIREVKVLLTIDFAHVEKALASKATATAGRTPTANLCISTCAGH